MLSAILFAHLAAQQCIFEIQLIYQRCVLSGPFVLKSICNCLGNCHREEPCCVTTHWTQLTYRFNRRTVEPFLPSAARGHDEPTSRCQTNPSIGTLRIDKPVIPGVPLIRWSTLFPLQSAGSLPHTFVIPELLECVLKKNKNTLLGL